jgi:hypothetical protein
MSKWLKVFEALIQLIGPIIAVLDAQSGHASFQLSLDVKDGTGATTLSTVGPVQVTL